MSDDHKKKHLRLVVNNEPAFRIKTTLERLREEHQSILEEKEEELEEEHNEAVENLRKEHSKELEDQKWYTRICYIGLAVATTAALCASKCSRHEDPQEIVQLNEDLNKDGLNDAYILLENGYKVPMYGAKTFWGMQYFNADKIERISDNIIDYQSIEDKLNENIYSYDKDF